VLQVTADRRHSTIGARVRRWFPAPVRRAGARIASARRASQIERELAALAEREQPVVVGPWLGEVGFELLYWVPFVRWFAERYGIPPDRLIAVSRGGAAAAWYQSVAGRSHDVLTFLSADDLRRRNEERTIRFGEQKQVAPTDFDRDIVDFVRRAEGRDVTTLHPATMYQLFAPYWWGHRPLEWLRQYMRFADVDPLPTPPGLPARYTAVKFYFNDCFKDTPENRVFVDRTIRTLAEAGPVVSLSTGVAVDDHAPCEPDVAAMQSVRHLLTPQNNLVVQSAIVAGASRFVGTYGGFAYLAPLSGVPAATYYTEPGSFSTRHLDLIRDVLQSNGRPELLEIIRVPGSRR
jgi:hypothetical protein